VLSLVSVLTFSFNFPSLGVTASGDLEFLGVYPPSKKAFSGNHNLIPID
jgi:hypothetical protein